MKKFSSFYLIFLFLSFVQISSYGDNSVVSFDRELFDRIYDKSPNLFMKNITHFGDPNMMLGVSIIFMAYGNEYRRETGRLLSSAFIGTALSVYAGKELIGRQRPLDHFGLEDPALPSGHTALAFSMATVMGNRHGKFLIPLYVGAGLVGFSRVYLGRHYPSDVLAGAIVGTLIGSIVVRNDSKLLTWKF